MDKEAFHRRTHVQYERNNCVSADAPKYTNDRSATRTTNPFCCGTTAGCKVRWASLLRILIAILMLIVVIDRTCVYYKTGDVSISPALTITAGWLIALLQTVSSIMAYIGFEQSPVI